MQHIGKIDIDIYKKISTNILTDEVVLTEKQREHIKLRHPKILEKYEKYFSKIIEEPDFILKDNARENTALIFKTINEKNKIGKIIGTVNLVIRLAVEGDDQNNKNSIITCIPIGENRLKSYRKNGKIM